MGTSIRSPRVFLPDLPVREAVGSCGPTKLLEWPLLSPMNFSADGRPTCKERVKFETSRYADLVLPTFYFSLFLYLIFLMFYDIIIDDLCELPQ